MPFTLRETVVGLKHLRHRWERVLTGSPAERYLVRLAAEHAQVSQARDAAGSLRLCETCGYALALLRLADGWLLETCSAAGLPPLLRNGRLESWAGRLPAPRRLETAAPSPHEPGPGGSGSAPAGLPAGGG